METFEADLAKMKVGPRDGGPAPIRGRMLDKNFKLDLSGFVFNRWSALLEEQQTIEDALDAKFWTDQVGKIMGHDKTRGRGDIIELRKLSTGLYAELIILEIAVGFVRVGLVRASEPEQVAIAEDSPLTTRWNVGARSHEVIRVSDKAVLQGGFQTKASAAAWIADHVAKMAA